MMLFLIALGGCFSGIRESPWVIIEGRYFPVEDVRDIIKGKTTRKEILDLFGEPYTKTEGRWTYYFVSERISWVEPPLSVNRQRSKKELIIILGDDAVDDFNFAVIRMN
jgi:hypothetical protein